LLALLFHTVAAAQTGTGTESASESGTGELHLIVFAADNTTLQGAVVTLPDGSTVVSDADGAVTAELAPGEHVLQLTAEEGSTPQPLPGVIVAAGETTQVIATLAEDGSIGTLDVMAPDMEAIEARQEAEAQAPTGPPGTLTGRVFSAEGGEPVAGARIYVAGQSVEATTDADGRFSMQVPEGTHSLSVIHTKYSTQTVDSVEVVAEQTTDMPIELTPAALELEDFVVTAPHIEGGVANLLDERRSSAQVSDSIGAEDIARMPASDAAGAAQRVVGATIVGGRFVFVRGLGERYSNALLNGAPLPSPEPDRATVPLDLFPAQILASLDISKTFTPDVPGDFAGGSVRIVTKDAPEEPVFAVSLSGTYNTQSTFADVYGQDSSSTDWLGFDDGKRALSPEIPDDYQLSLGNERPDGELVLRDQLNAQAPNINTPMSPKRTTLPPNLSGSVVGGQGWDIGEDSRAGVLASLIYRRSFSYRREFIRVYQALVGEEGPVELQEWVKFDDVRTAVDGVRWGAFVSGNLELSSDHKISLLGMRSQLADTTTRAFLDGFSGNTQTDISSTRLQFVSRSLTFGQLQGDHLLDDLNGAQVEWLLSLATADRDEPDTRDIVFEREAQNRQEQDWAFLVGTDSGRHFFSQQSELSKVAGLDWTQPLTDEDAETAVRAKAGGLVSLKDRSFESRRFNLTPPPRAPSDPLICGREYDPIQCPENLLVSENIPEVLSLAEGTRPGDAYEAGLDVLAGYLMGDVAIGEQWRFVAGARVEDTTQEILPFDQFSGERDEDDSNSLESTDVLPSASVMFSPLEKVNLRAAVTKTLARPQLRELAPFAFSDFFGGAQQSGNPDLKLTSILNADLRAEYYPSTREVLAASVFFKDFTDPIEPVFIPSSTTNVLTYRNAQGAQLWGLELEARKTLDFISEELENFTVIGSLMLADSQIRVVQTGNEFLTNTERPLVQQAPYVINASIDYENSDRLQFRLLYNVSGPQLVQVGTDGLDDAYLHPRHLVDLTASQGFGDHWKAKLTIQNLLNAEYLITQGEDERSDNVRNRYREGISIGVGVGYSH
jgi:outer membrane receptor protein involved in Fe transport